MCALVFNILLRKKIPPSEKKQKKKKAKKKKAPDLTSTLCNINTGSCSVRDMFTRPTV